MIRYVLVPESLATRKENLEKQTTHKELSSFSIKSLVKAKPFKGLISKARKILGKLCTFDELQSFVEKQKSAT